MFSSSLILSSHLCLSRIKTKVEELRGESHSIKNEKYGKKPRKGEPASKVNKFKSRAESSQELEF